MTTHQTVSEMHICDVVNCERTANYGGSFWDDKHLCMAHLTLVSEETIIRLRQASDDCVRESHEGGTPYLPDALSAFASAWDQALLEIKTAQLRCE